MTKVFVDGFIICHVVDWRNISILLQNRFGDKVFIYLFEGKMQSWMFSLGGKKKITFNFLSTCYLIAHDLPNLPITLLASKSNFILEVQFLLNIDINSLLF